LFVRAFKTLMITAIAGASFAVLPAMAQSTIQTGGAPTDAHRTTTVKPPVNAAHTGADPSQATPPMARRGASGVGADGG
jgi:hypothetical protein